MEKRWREEGREKEGGREGCKEGRKKRKKDRREEEKNYQKSQVIFETFESEAYIFPSKSYSICPINFLIHLY